MPWMSCMLLLVTISPCTAIPLGSPYCSCKLTHAGRECAGRHLAFRPPGGLHVVGPAAHSCSHPYGEPLLQL